MEYLDSSPTGDVRAPRDVLERDAPAEPEEPGHHQRLDAVREPAYLVLRRLRALHLRPVHVYLGHWRLEAAPRVPGKVHEEREHWHRRERLSPPRERRVRRVLLECGGVRTRLPHCQGGGTSVS